MKLLKLTTRVLSLALALSLCGSAFAMDSGIARNEEELNNNQSTAQELNSDDTMYGLISSKSDVDWYKVTFESDGMANFWVGNTTHNLTMEVYKEDSYKEAGYQNPDNYQTFVEDFDVEGGVEYYIKLTGASVSSYSFRTRIYQSV